MPKAENLFVSPVTINNEKDYLKLESRVLGFKEKAKKFETTNLFTGKYEYSFDVYDKYIIFSQGGCTNLISYNGNKIELSKEENHYDFFTDNSNPSHIYSKEGRNFVLTDISGPEVKKTVVYEEQDKMEKWIWDETKEFLLVEDFQIYGVISSGLIIHDRDTLYLVRPHGGTKTKIYKTSESLNHNADEYGNTFGIDVVASDSMCPTEHIVIIPKEVKRKNALFKKPIELNNQEEFFEFRNKYLGFGKESKKSKETSMFEKPVEIESNEKFEQLLDKYLGFKGESDVADLRYDYAKYVVTKNSITNTDAVFEPLDSGHHDRGLIYLKGKNIKVVDFFDKTKKTVFGRKTIKEKIIYEGDIGYEYVWQLDYSSAGIVISRDVEGKKMLSKINYDGSILDFFDTTDLPSYQRIGVNEEGVVLQIDDELHFVDYNGNKNIIYQLEKDTKPELYMNKNGVIVCTNDERIDFVSTN